MITPLRALALLFLTALSLLSPAWASDSGRPSSGPLVLTDRQGEYPLGRHLMILEDPTRALTIDDVLTDHHAGKFVASTKDVPSFGFSRSTYWLRVQLDRQTTNESQWLLEFGYAPMDRVDVFTVNTDGEVFTQRGGSHVPYAARPYPHHKHVFELILRNAAVATLLVTVRSDSNWKPSNHSTPCSIRHWKTNARRWLNSRPPRHI